MRSIVAVIAGHIIFTLAAVAIFALSGRDPRDPAPPSFIVMSTAFGAAAALAGGVLAAFLARRLPIRHALALTVVFSLEAIASLAARPNGSAIWSQVATLLVMAPCATVGGWLVSIIANPGLRESVASE